MSQKKRIPRLTDEQIEDVWSVRTVEEVENEFDDLDVLISSAVSRCINECDYSREEIADSLSEMFGQNISVAMLNTYTSEANPDRRIPASRLLVLIGLTGRFDILDALLREVGGKAIDRHSASVLKLGWDYVRCLNAEHDLNCTKAEIFPDRNYNK